MMSQNGDTFAKEPGPTQGELMMIRNFTDLIEGQGAELEFRTSNLDHSASVQLKAKGL